MVDVVHLQYGNGPGHADLFFVGSFRGAIPVFVGFLRVGRLGFEGASVFGVLLLLTER